MVALPAGAREGSCIEIEPSPIKRRIGEAAIAQIVEALAQGIVGIGQELDHHRLDVVAGAEFERFVEGGMDGDAAHLGDLRRLGVVDHRGIEAGHHLAQKMRMDGADDAVLGLEFAAVPWSRRRWRGRSLS